MPAEHILIPIHDFSAGGTEVIAFRLAEQWIAAGRRVTLLAGAEHGAMRARVPAGVAVSVLAPPVQRSTMSRLWLGKAMESKARALSPDVVFIPGNFHFILARALKRALPRTPIVAKISNPMLPGGIVGFLARATRLLPRYFAPIDMVVAMNKGLEAEHRRMAPGSRVVTIIDPNVPDTAPVQPMRDRRRSLGPARILLIGRLEPQKDVLLALRVLKALQQRIAAHLTVLGEGYLRAQIQAEVKRLALEDTVALPGFVADVTAALDAADVLLITSLYEGGPAVAVEALARGLPVVSTDCSYFLRELLHDEQLGRLVAGRSPAAIAAALEAQLTTPPASNERLRAAVEPSRYGASAHAYLAQFDQLTGSKSP
ncbi:glycosyltransferase [Novosphingobium sp.]|uniref:glycosyltransferase n=1 Tax=Novosphingobium sp. TaxID=1874826 RepID=UPI0025F2FC6B|nr:glycosyltransferase [Novosphingobium sp.]